MKKFLFLIFLGFSCSVGAAHKPTKVPNLKPSANISDEPRFSFVGINVAQLVQLIYGEILQNPFVVDPDVLLDQRSVSFRYDPSVGKIRPFILSFFNSLGLQVIQRNGVDYIRKTPPFQKPPEKRDVFVYRPRFRDGSYLVDLLAPLFQGEFTSRRAVHSAESDKLPMAQSPSGSAAASIDRKSDALVFAGSFSEITMLKKMLAQVDMPGGDVVVRGVLYEVQAGSNQGSGFSLALNLLGGKLGIKMDTAKSKGNVVSFSSATIEAAVTALAEDSRFMVRSTPTLRVASGQNGRFTVGEDVPVLGAVSYTGPSGTPVQSIEYRSSGAIFDLLPVVRSDVVDLTVMQQVSNFKVTETGVNDSPTLSKRELKTSLTVADGELIVIGGLADSKETDIHSGFSFLPQFMHAKSKTKSNTEILLILQLTRL